MATPHVGSIYITCSLSNPPAYNAIKNSVEVCKRNNVPGFESIKLITSWRHPLNLHKMLTKTEFSNKDDGVRKCQDLRRECCESLLPAKELTSKTVTSKTLTSSNSFDVIYILICSGCLKEYIEETSLRKIRLTKR